MNFYLCPFFYLWSPQFSSGAQSCPTLCDPMNRSTPGLPVHHQSPGLLKLMSIESVMPSSHLILCRPLLLLPPIPRSIRVFSSESALRIRWPKCWSLTPNCLLVCEAFPRPTPADQVTPVVAPSWMCTSACSASCCDHLIISDQSSTQCYSVRTTDTNCEMFLEQVTLGSLSSHSYLLRYNVGYFGNHIHKIPFSGPQAAGLNRRHQSGASQ